MSPAERSIFVFGCYLLGLGAVLVVLPNPMLALFGFAPTPEVWIRVVGMLVLFLGAYDVLAGRRHLAAFIRLSVPLRGSVILFFGAFVALGWAPPALLLFGAVDAAAAAWTALALRAERPQAGGSSIPA
jgi:cytochrome c biogenesis protein CcdA